VPNKRLSLAFVSAMARENGLMAGILAMDSAENASSEVSLETDKDRQSLKWKPGKDAGNRGLPVVDA